MYAVSKSEMLNHRERRANQTRNLCRGRYLPVEAIAVGSDGCIHLGLHLHNNVLVTELESGTLESEVPCCVQKLQESWHRKRELIEEVNLKLLEARGGVPMKNYTQVCSSTLKYEIVKVRK